MRTIMFGSAGYMILWSKEGNSTVFHRRREKFAVNVDRDVVSSTRIMRCFEQLQNPSLGWVKERERLERHGAIDRKKICNSRLLCRGKGARMQGYFCEGLRQGPDTFSKILKRLGGQYANAKVLRKGAAEEQGVKPEDEGCPRKGWMRSMRPAAWAYNQCS
jgi:hypothetical protein